MAPAVQTANPWTWIAGLVELEDVALLAASDLEAPAPVRRSGPSACSSLRRVSTKPGTISKYLLVQGLS
jgi:hypothetical protein